jgi:uncharacterized membrane protein YjjB (DUF3815 family)
MSFATLLASTPAGVYIGAFSGAAVYVIFSPDLNRFKQVTTFFISFLLGILGQSGHRHSFPGSGSISP